MSNVKPRIVRLSGELFEFTGLEVLYAQNVMLKSYAISEKGDVFFRESAIVDAYLEFIVRPSGRFCFRLNKTKTKHHRKPILLAMASAV